ncbi:MAG: MFS transporter [Candidatus Thorarchaeota archaeon]|nr:MFS transporter [Candidatus Thorarchaeota archaeon]
MLVVLASWRESCSKGYEGLRIELREMQDTTNSDWKSLRPVYHSALFCSFGFFLVGFLIPIVAYGNMQASATEVALVFSMLMLGLVLISPIAGKITKQGKRREAIAFGAIVRASAFVGMAVSILHSSILILISSGLVWGMGAALYNVGSDAEISERVNRKNRAEAFGKRESYNATGAVVGAFLGLWIAYTIGLESAFLFFAFANLVGGVAAVTNRPQLVLAKKAALEGKTAGAIGIGILALVVAAALDTFIASLLSPFVEIFILFNYPDLDIIPLALVYLPAGLISGVLGAPLGKFADKRNKIIVVSGAVIAGSSSTLTLAFVPVLFPVAGQGLLLISTLFTFSSITGVMAYTVMSSVLGTAYEGRAEEGFGMFEAAMGLARFSAPLVGGILWDFVNPVVPFVLVGLSGFFLIPIYVHGMRQYEQALTQRDSEMKPDDAQEL